MLRAIFFFKSALAPCYPLKNIYFSGRKTCLVHLNWGRRGDYLSTTTLSVDPPALMLAWHMTPKSTSDLNIAVSPSKKGIDTLLEILRLPRFVNDGNVLLRSGLLLLRRTGFLCGSQGLFAGFIAYQHTKKYTVPKSPRQRIQFYAFWALKAC